MNPEQLRLLLEGVRAGEVDVAEAQRRLRSSSDVADLGFANVDLQRRERCGFPEVIFCEGKTSEWILGVVRQLAAAAQDCLATRVSAEQAEHLERAFPQGHQDRLGRTFWLPASPPAPP